MYTAGFLVVTSLLAASANAHPEFNERRDCSHNDCLRAVRQRQLLGMSKEEWVELLKLTKEF